MKTCLMLFRYIKKGLSSKDNLRQSNFRRSYRQKVLCLFICTAIEMKRRKLYNKVYVDKKGVTKHERKILYYDTYLLSE